jgi:hypothetical protein
MPPQAQHDRKLEDDADRSAGSAHPQAIPLPDFASLHPGYAQASLNRQSSLLDQRHPAIDFRL